jgi:hypothetical protein
MQALLLVVERNGPTMPARIGMMKGAEPARAETGAGHRARDARRLTGSCVRAAAPRGARFLLAYSRLLSPKHGPASWLGGDVKAGPCRATKG